MNNGILVSEVEIIEDNISEIGKPEISKPSISTRGINGSWINTGSRYTKRSFYNTSQSIAIAIVGFVPGFGNIAGAIGIIHALWTHGQREVYYKITSFVDTSYIWEKSNCYAYRNSNHTGLLSVTYGGVTRIHW